MRMIKSNALTNAEIDALRQLLPKVEDTRISCPTCSGTGKVKPTLGVKLAAAWLRIVGVFEDADECPRCNGDGKIPNL